MSTRTEISDRAGGRDTTGPDAFVYVAGQDDLVRSFSTLESAFGAITDGILIADLNGHIFGFNARFAEMWGLSGEVMALRSDERAVQFSMSQLKDPHAFVARIRELYATPESESSDTLELNDGRSFERGSVPLRINGAAVGRVWTFRDVTDRRRVEDALLASEARFRAVFDHSAVGIALIETDGRIAATNLAFQDFLGYNGHELADQRLYHLVPEEDVDQLAAALSAIAGGAIADLTIEQRYTRRNGETVWAALTMSLARDRSGNQSLGIIAMVQDIGTRKSLEARLTHQASHDPLTNLANRTLFKQRLEVALHRAAQRDQVVVMFLDVDDFKAVNDSTGHSAGDQLLVTTAARLLNATRGSDAVARFGGDEFAILLENVRDDDEARIVADRITRTMRQPIVVGDETVVTGVSIGIARAHSPQDGADEILRNADVAMYAAKSGGKGRYKFFEPAMRAAVVNRIELETDLRNAVAAPSTAFVLHYQSLVQLNTEAVIGVEALIRWRHPSRGELQPAEFIGVAEETGLIVPMGRWVLREACTQAFSWWHDLADDAQMSVAVNVSGRQLQDPAFVSDVAEALADSRLPPSRLVLEITETVIMHRTELMLQRLVELKQLGVRLAIDDFGTGYSSLSYLQQFPIDIIKIDKAFISGLDRDPAGAALTRTIIGLGWTLGMATVAEGIERSSQRETLTDLGCAVGQGFLFERPVAASAVSKSVSKPDSKQEID